MGSEGAASGDEELLGCGAGVEEGRRVRSSWTSEEAMGCHCRVMPVREVVAWSAATGEGAAPEGTTAGSERPADRLSGLRMRTRYAIGVAGSEVNGAGRESEALEGPGVAMTRRTTGQAVVEGCLTGAAEGLGSRQISAVRGEGAARPSVVREGVVQWRTTREPTRWAVRSRGISARWSEGGRGGPGLAQEIRRGLSAAASAAAMSLGVQEGNGDGGKTGIGACVFSLASGVGSGALL